MRSDAVGALLDGALLDEALVNAYKVEIYARDLVKGSDQTIVLVARAKDVRQE